MLEILKFYKYRIFYSFDVDENKADLPTIPVYNVLKTMKLAVPNNFKIAADAKNCMQECAAELISFITSEAAEKCRVERRKTLSGSNSLHFSSISFSSLTFPSLGEDILMAFSSLGLDHFCDPLRLYLAKLREIRMAKKAYGGDHGSHSLNMQNRQGNQNHDDIGGPEPHSQQNITQNTCTYIVIILDIVSYRLLLLPFA